MVATMGESVDEAHDAEITRRYQDLATGVMHDAARVLEKCVKCLESDATGEKAEESRAAAQKDLDDTLAFLRTPTPWHQILHMDVEDVEREIVEPVLSGRLEVLKHNAGKGADAVITRAWLESAQRRYSTAAEAAKSLGVATSSVRRRLRDEPDLESRWPTMDNKKLREARSKKKERRNA